ncbi:conserved repeat domain-containing protein [Sphingomonas gellani]|uniref:Conserved repeat domain-containing protein n=2 Tax=Sphingomonas gellani TaxID=1166340 RepID=A0A1H8B4A8_9SPHN|nr:conserved repeat domain-containing protein [Sphingomonas gellani]
MVDPRRGAGGGGTWRPVGWLALLSTLILAVPTMTSAATPAGSTIVNTAFATMDGEGRDVRIASNAAALTVAEILDVKLALAATEPHVPRGQLAAVPFTLANTGNGHEAFAIKSEGGVAVQTFAIDRDGDGRFDPAVDLPLRADAVTPPMDAGATAKLLALVQGDTAGPADLIVQAHAQTASGQPGSVHVGEGDGGGDAIVGPGTASDTLRVTFTVDDDATAPNVTLTKTQQVTAPDGGTAPVKGATVAYSIEARFEGGAPLRDAHLTDPVPAGTRFVPGSLLLDGQALTDAADGDAGRCDGASIDVSLGDVAGPTTHTLRFQVTIQ